MRFNVPGGDTPVEVLAAVARSRRVPPRLASITPPGVGVRISSAPAEYYEFLANLVAGESTAALKNTGAPPVRTTSSATPSTAPQMATSAAASNASAKPPTAGTESSQENSDGEPRYRVRAELGGGKRTRNLVVWAGTPDEAKEEALVELGDDWKIISVERF